MSLFESNFPDILALSETNVKESINFSNSSVRDYLRLTLMTVFPIIHHIETRSLICSSDQLTRFYLICPRDLSLENY